VSRYAEAKPYAVPESLSDLTGPVSGTVVLPRHIDWGPDYVYDLADESDLALLYERVIREAQTPDDLVAFLDGATLRRLWPRLIVPRPARVRWEARFEELPHQAVASWTISTNA
jgi:hypothetical protein